MGITVLAARVEQAISELEVLVELSFRKALVAVEVAVLVMEVLVLVVFLALAPLGA